MQQNVLAHQRGLQNTTQLKQVQRKGNSGFRQKCKTQNDRMGNWQNVTNCFLLYIVPSDQLRESRRTRRSNDHDLQDHVVDGARFDLGGFDAHGDDDTVNGLDGVLRLLFPPSHCLLEVLVEGLHLGRSELKAFEPFLVVRFRQGLRWIVSEEVTGRAWSNQ